MNPDLRTGVLKDFTADREVVQELLSYNHNHFKTDGIEWPLELPVTDEPFVKAWREYRAEAGEKGVFNTLQSHLPQLSFPVGKGVSGSRAYRDATLRGVPLSEIPDRAPLELEKPESLELHIHQTPAGGIPLIITREREDFVRLIQALSVRNEPVEVPESMGALTIGNYVNWERIRQLKREWREKNPFDLTGEGWRSEFSRIEGDKALYQDRFIVLSNGPYSAVPASGAGFPEDEWPEKSLIIRRDHECTHYVTRRLLGSMKNRIMDEVMADYMGMTAATGSYSSDFFLKFMGLEAHPVYRQGGRFENYRGDPPLSDEAFTVLQSLTVQASQTLEIFHDIHSGELTDFNQRTRLVLALGNFTLEEIASDRGLDLIREKYAFIRGNVSFP